ncbi:MAG: amino acid ABC transporter permease [Clostridiales bacterium]|nr:amino acid ABC transporter permease [Clostridiales bacterium]
MSFVDVTLRLLEGFSLTCVIFIVTLIFALPLGLAISFASMSRYKAVRAISKTFVWMIRSTPLMLQVIVVFYGPGLIWGPGFFFERMTAVLIAFIINYAAYFSEIYRGGIQSISVGQYEAGHVLGMTNRQIFMRVVLLQVVKRILAPMSNEVITLVKDTSLARIIAVKELIMMSQEYISAHALIWPLFYSAVFYMIFCGGLTLLFGAAEKKLSYFRS